MSELLLAQVPLLVYVVADMDTEEGLAVLQDIVECVSFHL